MKLRGELHNDLDRDPLYHGLRSSQGAGGKANPYLPWRLLWGTERSAMKPLRYRASPHEQIFR